MENYLAGQQKTKKKIFLAALKVFAKYGYENSNVDQIAQEAKTAKGSIYYHFKSKEEILIQLVEMLIKNFLIEASSRYDNLKDPSEKIKRVIEAQCELHKKYPDVSRLIVRNYFYLNPVWEKLRQDKVRFGKLMFENCQTTGDCRKDIDSRVMAMFMHIFSLITVTMVGEILTDKKIDEICEASKKILTEGIFSKK